MLSDLVQPIRLDERQRMLLGGVLTERVRGLESAHAQCFNNIRTHWKWYHAEPKTKTKNFPWPNASNIVAPVIMSQADARTAQDFGLLWGSRKRFFLGDTENEDFARRYLAEVVKFLNWGWVREIRPFWALLDGIEERNVIGGTVWSATWVQRERYVFAPGAKKPQRVVTKRGVEVTHWPAEKILWEPGQDVRESEVVVTQRLLTWGEIGRMLEGEEGYYEDAVRKLFGFPHDQGSPGAEVQAEKEARSGIDPSYRLGHRASYDLRTLWLDWPALKGMGIPGLADAAVVQDDEGLRTTVPITVELAPDSGEVLRCLTNPYLTVEGNPFFGAYYKRQSGYPRGVGLAKRLEQPQRGQSTVINQAIDARTREISMAFKTTDPKLKERPITPNGGLYVQSMGDAEAFPTPGANPMDMALANMLQVFAERVGGSNDPVLGRESRSGGHPSPATNYMGQLQQAAKMGATPTLILAETLSEMGLYVAGLYQQFDTDETGRIERVFGSSDAAKIQEWLFPTDMTLVGNLSLSLTALSDENPQVATQQALMVAQVTQAYYANVLKVVQVMANPQVPQPVKDASLKALKVLGTCHQKFLEAANYDEAQEAILSLEEGDTNNALAQLTALAQQQLGGGAAPGMAGGAGGGEGAAGQPGDGAVPPGAPPSAGGGVPELAGF